MEGQVMNGLYLEVSQLVDAVEVGDRLFDDLYFLWWNNIVERRQFIRCRYECWSNNSDGGLDSCCDGGGWWRRRWRKERWILSEREVGEAIVIIFV
jgi:hypothetical protein